jgi:hypothetical protein
VSALGETELCLFESKVVPENASNVVCSLHPQAIRRMLSGLGRRMEGDGPVVRIPHPKIGHPVRQARDLHCGHRSGVSLEVNVRDLDRATCISGWGDQHCEDCSQMPGSPPDSWLAPSHVAPAMRAANFSIHSIHPELMTQEVYVAERVSTVVYR